MDVDALYDVVSISAKLKATVKEKDEFREKFLEEEGARKLLEGKSFPIIINFVYFFCTVIKFMLISEVQDTLLHTFKLQKSHVQTKMSLAIKLSIEETQLM